MDNSYDKFIESQRKEYSKRVESQINTFISNMLEQGRSGVCCFWKKDYASSELKKIQCSELTASQKLGGVLLLYKEMKGQKNSKWINIIGNAFNGLDKGISADVTIPYHFAATKAYQEISKQTVCP